MAANNFNDTVVMAVMNAGYDDQGPNIYAQEAAQWLGISPDAVVQLARQHTTPNGFNVAGLTSALQQIAPANTMQNVAGFVDQMGQVKDQQQKTSGWDQGPLGGFGTALMGTGLIASAGALNGAFSGVGSGGSGAQGDWNTLYRKAGYDLGHPGFENFGYPGGVPEGIDFGAGVDPGGSWSEGAMTGPPGGLLSTDSTGSTLSNLQAASGIAGAVEGADIITGGVPALTGSDPTIAKALADMAGGAVSGASGWGLVDTLTRAGGIANGVRGATGEGGGSIWDDISKALGLGEGGGSTLNTLKDILGGGIGAYGSNETAKTYADAMKYAVDKADPFSSQRGLYQTLFNNLNNGTTNVMEAPWMQNLRDTTIDNTAQRLSSKYGGDVSSLGVRNAITNQVNATNAPLAMDYLKTMGNAAGMNIQPNAGTIAAQGAAGQVGLDKAFYGNLGTMVDGGLDMIYRNGGNSGQVVI